MTKQIIFSHNFLEEKKANMIHNTYIHILRLVKKGAYILL